ncbi:MAG: UbiA family prenyltransferase [Planctomycetota bacterium]|jgi:protoheme IX farnesyltransferase
MSCAPDAAPPAKPAVAAREAERRQGLLSGLLELTKARITVFVTLSVATGYLLFTERIETGILLPMLGVFLLGMGSAALNQVQEASIDARMGRTRRRPIPAGAIPRDWAAFVALVLIGAGLTVLSSAKHHALVCLGLGVLAVVWYNAVYLVLKRVTAFAVVPGSLVGAIPPVIGWCAAGGVVTDETILEIAFFFFLWQIPHFWLLLLLYGREYEEAGLPSPTGLLAREQFGRVTFVWILAVVASGIALAVTQRLHLPFNMLALVASIWLGIAAFGILQRPDDRKEAFGLFMRVNLYALTLMTFISANAVIFGR